MDGRSSTGGEVHELEVLAYDAVGKAYSWYVIDNFGLTVLSKVVIEGDVLTLVLPVEAENRTYQVRGTLKGLGADTLTWLQEYSEDGKTWKPFCRATDTRGQ